MLSRRNCPSYIRHLLRRPGQGLHYFLRILICMEDRMIVLAPVTLEGNGVRLEPLVPEHANALASAAADGRLWELWFTSVPEPEGVGAYLAEAFDGQRAGHMLPWVVRELETDRIVGSTRYHDI